jgi:hypothetical protein
MSKRDYVISKAFRDMGVEKGLPSALRGKQGIRTYARALQTDPRAAKRMEELAIRQGQGRARASGTAIERAIERRGYWK